MRVDSSLELLIPVLILTSGILPGRCSEHDLSLPEGHKHQVGGLCRTAPPHLFPYAMHTTIYALTSCLGLPTCPLGSCMVAIKSAEGNHV